MKKFIPFLILILVFNALAQRAPDFSIEGHRGARGYLPENTIPSFIKALEMGADTIELDLAVSRDGELVVSHEHWFSSVISSDPQGRPITPEKEKEHNIFKMDYREVKRYDVGIRGNRDFPLQQKVKAYKPRLKDVFKAVDRYAKKKRLKYIRYNIEIKSSPAGDGTFHPAPDIFAKLVADEIRAHKLEKTVIVQSFDVRPLQELKKIAPALPLALLVGNKDGIEKNLERLGFVPDTYSPHFSLVDAALVAFCHEKNMKIVPWTVNETSDLEKMKAFKLDGIITDYPDRAVAIFKK